MGKGRRFDPDEQLNFKKVFAAIIAVVVIIMFVIAIKTILSNGKPENDGPINYYSVYLNEKWGVIDSKGNYVVEPTYDEMVVVPNKEKAVFLCTYDVDYNNGTYKTKAIDANGNQLFTEYESVEPIENFDSNNKMWYETSSLKVKKNGRYGTIDLEGKSVVTCEFSEIHSLKGYKDKFITVKENLYGLVDYSGKILVYNECKSDSAVIDKAALEEITLEATIMPSENTNPKNIGDWHISKDDNSSFYTKD